MTKYTLKDVIGKTQKLNSGAVAGRVKNDTGKVVFRIIQGAHPAGSSAAKAAMAKLRARRTGPHPITQKDAQAAFNKYYSMKAKTPRLKEPRWKSPKQLARAKAYDINYARPSKYVVNDSRYLRNPGRFDFKGVDLGSKVRKVAGPKAVKADQDGGFWW